MKKKDKDKKPEPPKKEKESKTAKKTIQEIILKDIEAESNNLNIPSLYTPHYNLVILDVQRCSIDDNTLGCIAQLAELRHLNVAYNFVSDFGLEHLLRLVNLEYLNLVNCIEVSDFGLRTVGEIHSLKYLFIGYLAGKNPGEAKMTMVGLRQLKNLRFMEELYLCACNIEERDAEELHAAWENKIVLKTPKCFKIRKGADFRKGHVEKEWMFNHHSKKEYLI